MKSLHRNRSPGVQIYDDHMPVSVHQHLIFVHLGLRSILVLFEQAKMGEDEVLVNAYTASKPLLGESRVR